MSEPLLAYDCFTDMVPLQKTFSLPRIPKDAVRYLEIGPSEGRASIVQELRCLKKRCVVAIDGYRHDGTGLPLAQVANGVLPKMHCAEVRLLEIDRQVNV